MRIAILGNAGSGKSTLARRLAQDFALPLHEVDRLMWGPDWEMTPRDTFDAAHRAILKDETWIIDGMGLRGMITERLARATHILFLDLPLWQNYWLLAGRQARWQAGETADMPAGHPTPPDTKDLFATVWMIDQQLMPWLRQTVSAQPADKRIMTLTDFDEVKAFSWPD